MVIQSARPADGVPRCPSGHVAVCVTRGFALRRVCPECLSAALKVVESREITVNDYLARLEGDGCPPKVSASEARAAEEMFRASLELHGDQTAGSLRKVVRAAAKSAGVTSAEAMKWTLKQMASLGLAKLRDQLQAG